MFGLEADSLHPITIHFPIALLTCAFLFDAGSVFLKKDSLRDAGFWCQVVGTLGLIPAIISGFWADESYGHMDEPFPIHSTHGSMQIMIAILFLGLFIWRLKNKFDLPKDKLFYVYLAINGLLVAGLTYGSHMGAILGERI